MRSLSRPQNSFSDRNGSVTGGGVSYGNGLPSASNFPSQGLPPPRVFTSDFDSNYDPYGRNRRRGFTPTPAINALVASKSSTGASSIHGQQRKQTLQAFTPYSGGEQLNKYSDEKDFSGQSYYSAPAFGVGDDSNLEQFNLHVDKIRGLNPALAAVDARKRTVEIKRAAQLAASSSTGSSTTAASSSQWNTSGSTRSSSDMGSTLGTGLGYSERPTGVPYTDPRYNILSDSYQPASYVSMLAPPPSSSESNTPTPSLLLSSKKEKKRDRNRPKFDRIGSNNDITSSDGRSLSPRPPSDQDSQSEYQPSNIYATPRLPSGSAKEPTAPPLIGLKRAVRSFELRAKFGMMDIQRKLGRL